MTSVLIQVSQHHQPVLLCQINHYLLKFRQCKACLPHYVLHYHDRCYSPLSLSDKKIFSPNNLTKNDVTEIWLMIFKRFTSAVSLGKYLSRLVHTVILSPLVCHGTGNERQELSSKLKQRISDKAET